MRIAKNNLAYPLLRDTFSLLGSSKCEVMSVLDLKDAFHSLQLSEKSQKYCGILPYFGNASYLYQRMPMGLNVFPLIWQMYINTILHSLQNKKYCEAIMDDLLLFTPSKKVHMDKLEDLLKALRKNGLKRIEENSPFQESIISEVYERPDKSYFQEPIELRDLIDTNNIVQQFLMKQTEIDKILEVIKRKVLKGMHLPLTIKEIQAGYLSSLYFKDIFLYLAHNRLPNKKAAIKRVELLAEKYIMLDSLLFKLTTILGKETALLAIPESCADKIITLYHSNLFAGHQGVIKMYLMISDRFYIPNLMHYLRSYIK